LHPPAAANVTAAIIRIEQGNFSNARGVGSGVFEYSRVNFGPGYRIYFGKDGDQLIILLWWNQEEAAAGHQSAAERWHDHKRRKKQGAI